jgi:hypothetical protein
MIVLVDNGTGGFGARRVRVRDRAVARSRSSRLDRDLADGKSPDATVTLAIWAQHLVSSTSRWKLARALEHLSAVARRSPDSCPSRVPICAEAVREAQAHLRALTDRLESQTLVAPRGIAMLRLLLADGCGPLYGRGQDRQHSLPTVLQAVQAALDPV